MTKLLTSCLPALFLVSGLFSCDRPECRSTNVVFNNYSPEAKEYKKELVRQLKLKANEKVNYWFDKYSEDDGKPVLQVYVQGEGLCAKTVLKVENTRDKIEGLIAAKGLGYGGARLEGLKFEIVEVAGTTAFVYRGLARIID